MRGSDIPRETAGKVLKFLSEKQDFKALYKKFPKLDEKVVAKLLSWLSEDFRSALEIECYTDGSARPNPGAAGAGVVIYENSKKVKSIAKHLGIKSNNQAEYGALLIALKEVSKFVRGKAKVRFFSDSQLLVNQINGLWKVKDPDIAGLRGNALKEIEKLLRGKKTEFSITYIPREKNKEADALSSIAAQCRN